MTAQSLVRQRIEAMELNEVLELPFISDTAAQAARMAIHKYARKADRKYRSWIEYDTKLFVIIRRK